MQWDKFYFFPYLDYQIFSLIIHLYSPNSEKDYESHFSSTFQILIGLIGCICGSYFGIIVQRELCLHCWPASKWSITPLWNDNTLYVLRKNGSPFSSRLTPCCRFQLEISDDDDQVVLHARKTDLWQFFFSLYVEKRNYIMALPIPNIRKNQFPIHFKKQKNFLEGK